MTALDLLLFAQNQIGRPGGMPGGQSPTVPPGAAGGVAVVLITMACFGIFGLLLTALSIACVWKIFTKAGEPGWASLVPIYNLIVLFNIFTKAGEPGWAVIVPFYNTIVLAKVFGKDIGFALGLIFLPFVFLPMLAFGSAEFIGASRSSKSRRRRDYDEEEEEERPRPTRRRAADDEDDRPRGRRDADEDRPRRRPRDEDDEDRPRRRPRDD